MSDYENFHHYDEGYASGYAAGQKAERERCRRIADEFCKEVDPQDGSYIQHRPVTGDRIAAAIMEDNTDDL